MMGRTVIQVALICATLAVSGAALADEPGGRIAQLNRGFLEHVRTLGPERAAAVERGLASGNNYEAEMPASFVPDALEELYPAYRDGLRAFDDRRYADAERLLSPLAGHADRYVAANAQYFRIRALAERGLLEEAEVQVRGVLADAGELARYTPYAPQLWFVRAYCEASNLRFDEAAGTLRELQAAFPEAAEPVRVGARQLLLEIERRERGTLDEVATIMGYSAARLAVADTTERLRTRQDEVIALLDELIDDAKQREQQQQQSGNQRRAAQDDRPRSGADQSTLPESGEGKIGELHGAPKADPGEAWGQLPPAEREKILESLRERFPSRYRQLVEQYYRSLAEEK